MNLKRLPVVFAVAMTGACAPNGFSGAAKTLSEATLEAIEQTAPLLTDEAEAERQEIRRARIAQNLDVIDLSVACDNYVGATSIGQLNRCHLIYQDTVVGLDNPPKMDAIQMQTLLGQLEGYANALNLLAVSTVPSEIGAATSGALSSAASVASLLVSIDPGLSAQIGKVAQPAGPLATAAARGAQTRGLRKAVAAGQAPLQLGVILIANHLRARQPEWRAVVTELTAAGDALDDAVEANDPRAHVQAIKRLEAAHKALRVHEKDSPIPLLFAVVQTHKDFEDSLKVNPDPEAVLTLSENLKTVRDILKE